jgi:hypothetical protein
MGMKRLSMEMLARAVIISDHLVSQSGADPIGHQHEEEDHENAGRRLMVFEQLHGLDE